MKTEKQDKQSKRANALRENLKRRKAAPKTTVAAASGNKKEEKESK